MNFVGFAVKPGKEKQNSQTLASLKHVKVLFVKLVFGYQMELELLMMKDQVLAAVDQILLLVSSGMCLWIQPSQ